MKQTESVSPLLRSILTASSFILLFHMTASSDLGTPHPDGNIGLFNACLWGQYASRSADDWTPVLYDKQKIGLTVFYPARKQITIDAGYFIEPGDTLFHNYRLGIRIYPGLVISTAGNCNPDGPVGGPVISVGIGGRLLDRDPTDQKLRADISVYAPIATYFTLGAGWNYLEENDIRQADEFFGSLSIYPARYPPDEEYTNPDGPKGSPAFILKGGGSKNGAFGQLDMVFPLMHNYTLALYVRGERIPEPYTRSTILGGRVHYYPGQF